MNIEKTKEIKNFFKRCNSNLDNDLINNYLNVLIQSKEEEEEIKEELHDIFDPEFKGDKTNWPSLYIDVDEFKKSPYHASIHLDHIKDKDFEYVYEEMPADIIYNIDEVKPDPLKELNDYMVLRAFNKPLKTTVLKQKGKYWMSDNPSEAITFKDSIDKAHGRVLTYGLGIGYFVYMCLLKEEVESVTVIELNESVINMFTKYLLPQFPHQEKIKIVKGNALDYFNRNYIERFDFVFADIWMNHEDGLSLIEKMLERYNAPTDKVDFWIEFSCTEVITSLIFQYFECLSENRKLKTVPKYRRIVNKIERYFNDIDKTVDTVDELKYYMYDKKTIRNILSVKL